MDIGDVNNYGNQLVPMKGYFSYTSLNSLQESYLGRNRKLLMWHACMRTFDNIITPFKNHFMIIANHHLEYFIK